MIPKKPLVIVIVGGSLAGLMHGIMLRALGHDVYIVEQADDVRESHMAGVCCAADCLEFLRRFDRITSPFGLRSQRLQFVASSGFISHYLKAPRLVTSWDALYWRLRANFDGCASMYYPDPPPAAYDGAGTGRFLSRHKLSCITAQGDTVRVMITSINVGKEKLLMADFVLAADGPNSDIRQKYLPWTKRKFAGYVAWRGTVPERELSGRTLELFDQNVTLNLMRDDQSNNHALVYIIPGENGSLAPSERHVNFLWYTNESNESLAQIMLDKNGHRHRYIVPSGLVRPETWDRVCAKADLLSKPHREVLTKIKKPFLQSITDFTASRAVFEQGKVLLVGDALSLYRPHTASSTNQAAFQCLMLERLVKGDIDTKEWEREVLQFATLHCRRSIWYGENYQRKLWDALPSAFQYWHAVLADCFRVLWSWKPTKLRW